jgi:hypothetical protein
MRRTGENRLIIDDAIPRERAKRCACWETRIMSNSFRHSWALRAALAALVGAMTVAAPAVAAQPQAVNIVSVMHFTGPNTGTFETSGSASDTGLICKSGTVLDLGYVFGGYQSGQKVQIRVTKEFTCSDGSGTFIITIQVHADFDGTETFHWVVQDGTGDYQHLHGSGDGVTEPGDDTYNTNLYTGLLNG